MQDILDQIKSVDIISSNLQSKYSLKYNPFPKSGIAIIDDVVSTCGTIDAIYRLLKKANLEICKIACVLCEGKVTKDFKGIPVISCGFIPLMENNND